jgi:dipeptidyl-peptidase-4
MAPSVLSGAALLSLLGLASAIEPPRGNRQPTGNGDRLLSYNETTPRATIAPSGGSSFSWAQAGRDGQYITTNDAGDLVLTDIATGDSETFLTADQQPEDAYDFWIGADEKRVLFATNYTKEYRHSYYANYQILNVETGESEDLVDDQVGDIQYAVLAPKGDTTAFVRGNDVYLRSGSGEVTRVTSNGGPDQFNGVPDWVYEEEIFGDRFTLWFSPDAKYIAFLSFNETGVDTFTIPYYMDNQPIAPQYPDELDLRYPKVGSINPTVELNILDVASGEYQTVELEGYGKDTIIGEVQWVTAGHSALIYRAFNRPQNLDKHVVVDPATLKSTVVRERDGTDGWLENTISISYVGPITGSGKSNTTCSNSTYYIDVSDESGWNHIYLHSVKGGEPVQLTEGEWEVASVLFVDPVRSLVYYLGTTRHSTERHLYSVSWATGEITALVDDEVPAVYSASFSSEGGYYTLNYRGPDVPYQELYEVGKDEPLRVIQSNAAFYKRIEEYRLPNVSYFELEHPEGFSLNVMEYKPANFDPSKKYPILFTPYGGPNSQYTTKTFQPLNWKFYVASDPELEYVIYTVDNRGTALKGREFRSTVVRQLGKLEPLDQIWAAEQLIERNEWIDADKVGIWGWSYGGYLAAKTVEVDSGVFSIALITAPVTDWRFYDSMYTERYMGVLEDNEDGYANTAVHNVDGFKNIAGTFSVLHGTGDDNVHYQNSAAMIDLLVGAGVPEDKFKMFAFTDSDHSIAYNNALNWIYKFFMARLYEEKQRKPDAQRVKHQWGKREGARL